MRKTGSRHGVWVLALIVMTGGLVLLSSTPASATWSAPSFFRSIGGVGSTENPWGIDYSPVTNQYYVGDYLNYQVRV